MPTSIRTTSPQVVKQLRSLTRSWRGEKRCEGVCDILLDRLLDLRPDLCCNPAACHHHQEERP